MSPLYYVAIDPNTRIVRTWYSLNYAPTAPGFFQITQDEFNRLSSMPGAKLTSDGTLEEYTPPPPPLKPLAQQAMLAVQQQASFVAAMGETFGPDMRAYVKALQAIIKGSDTTSTTLPIAPSDPTT